MHPHLYELDQVNFDIQQNHRDALQHEQRRLARGTQPDRVTTIMMSLRATLSTVQARFHQVPVEAAAPTAAKELVVTPADSAAVT